MDPDPGKQKHKDHPDPEHCTKLTLSTAGSLTDRMAVGGLGVWWYTQALGWGQVLFTAQTWECGRTLVYTLSESHGGNLSVSPPNHSTHTQLLLHKLSFFSFFR
jgi:hypothetical protein